MRHLGRSNLDVSKLKNLKFNTATDPLVRAVCFRTNSNLRRDKLLMKRSCPTLIARVTLLATLALSSAAVYGQIPDSGSSAREIPTEVEKTAPRVVQIIKRAENSIRQRK